MSSDTLDVGGDRAICRDVEAKVNRRPPGLKQEEATRGKDPT